MAAPEYLIAPWAVSNFYFNFYRAMTSVFFLWTVLMHPIRFV